jgi:hypothetical protein
MAPARDKRKQGVQGPGAVPIRHRITEKGISFIAMDE